MLPEFTHFYKIFEERKKRVYKIIRVFKLFKYKVVIYASFFFF